MKEKEGLYCRTCGAICLFQSWKLPLGQPHNLLWSSGTKLTGALGYPGY
jgi:hypothetical protein